MFDAVRRLYYKLSQPYPTRWYWPVIRIFGGPDGTKKTVYMTRIILGPKTPWGRLYLHIFHREDIDRDPHDHPFDYWTLPLNQGYTEEVFEHDDTIGASDGRGPHQCFKLVDVPQGQWGYRPATHTHRIVTCDYGWPLITLVWRGPTERRWGFWCHLRTVASAVTRWRYSIPWEDYTGAAGTGVASEHANVDGQDDLCPGQDYDRGSY